MCLIVCSSVCFGYSDNEKPSVDLEVISDSQLVMFEGVEPDADVIQDLSLPLDEGTDVDLGVEPDFEQNFLLQLI